MVPTKADMANLSASYPLTPPPSARPITRVAGSSILSNPTFQPLRTEQLVSQSPGATISRSDTPFSFLRQFSNNSQHGSGSNQSSPTWQYLSPPIIDSGGETPPYKPDQNDYFSLNMLVHSRKRKTGLRNSDQSGSRDGSGSSSSPLLTNDEPRSPSPVGLPLRGSKKANDSHDVPHPGLKTRKKTGEKDPGKSMMEKPLISAVRHHRPHFSADTRTSSDPTSLNTRASSDAKDSKSGESSPEYGGMIQVWSTRSSSRKRRKDNASEGSRIVKGRRRSPGKLETPATIVLRKASVLSGTSFAVTEHGLQTPGASALLSIDSQAATSNSNDDSLDHMIDPSGSHALSLGRSTPMTQRGASTADAGGHTTEKPQPKLESIETAEQLVSTSSLTGPSTVAEEPAITFADFHKAFRTLSITATSQQGSLSPLAQRRRKSALPILSRSSVHEIIWKEDDLPSPGSSVDTYSPSLSLTRINTGTEGRKDDTGRDSPVFAENLSTSPPDLAGSELPQTISSDNADGAPGRTPKLDHDLSGWSWSQRPSTDIKVKEEPANLPQHNTAIDSSQEPSSRKRSTVRRKKNLSLPFVESFTPPSEPKPAEGQRSHHANFNNSHAGHTPLADIMRPTPDDCSTSSPTGGPRKRRKSSSFKNYPDAPTRFTQDTKEGYAIGTSSHERRTSHSFPHRQLSHPRPDLSQLQEPQPSSLRRISTVINWRGKEESDPIIGSSPDTRSADSPSYLPNTPGRAAGGFVPLTLTAEPAAEEACPHRLPAVEEPRTDKTGSTYITQPLKLVGTPDARADVDCTSCRQGPVAERTVSMDRSG